MQHVSKISRLSVQLRHAARQQDFDRAPLTASSTPSVLLGTMLASGNFGWRLPIVSCRSLPSWCNPQWQDDDLFKLTNPELDTLKLRVAVCVKARYKGNVSGDFGMEVGGTKPLIPEASEPQLRERSGKVEEVPFDSKLGILHRSKIRFYGSEELQSLPSLPSRCYILLGSYLARPFYTSVALSRKHKLNMQSMRSSWQPCRKATPSNNGRHKSRKPAATPL